MSNVECAKRFYTAFSNRDSQTMSSCYHNDIVFEDPAFGELKGDQASNMWHMLVGRLDESASIEHTIISEDENKVVVNWIAQYPYGPKKRRVINNITGTLTFKDGLIIDHRDQFDLWKWSRQALGIPGLLLGWSPFLKKKIHKMANKSLEKFIT